MVSSVLVNGMKVHTGVLGKEDDPSFLASQRKHTSEITDIDFYRRTPDGIAERVPYSPWHVARGRQYLGVRVKKPIGEEACLLTTGTYNVRELLEDLGVVPLDLSPAIGRQLTAYGDTAVWGISVPQKQ